MHTVHDNMQLLVICLVVSDATGTFPDYPEEEDGGSTLIFAEKTPQQVFINEFIFWCEMVVIHADWLTVSGSAVFKLMEELAAKDEEDANKNTKGKEEKKDKGKKDKGKGGDEVHEIL